MICPVLDSSFAGEASLALTAPCRGLTYSSTTFWASNCNDQLPSRRPLTQGNDPGFRLAIERLRSASRHFVPEFARNLSRQNSVQRPSWSGTKTHPRIDLCRAVGVRLQQNLGAADPLAAAFQPVESIGPRVRGPAPSILKICKPYFWKCVGLHPFSAMLTEPRAHGAAGEARKALIKPARMVSIGMLPVRDPVEGFLGNIGNALETRRLNCGF